MFTWAHDDDKQEVEIILMKFEAYRKRQANITWERHVFNTHNQHNDETIDQYVHGSQEESTDM